MNQQQVKITNNISNIQTEKSAKKEQKNNIASMLQTYLSRT